MKQNRESRDTPTFTWSTLSNKGTKVIQWKKGSLATHVARTTGCPYAKKKKSMNLTLYLLLYIKINSKWL